MSFIKLSGDFSCSVIARNEASQFTIIFIQLYVSLLYIQANLAKHLASLSLASAVGFFLVILNLFQDLSIKNHPPEIGGFYLSIIIQYMKTLNSQSFSTLSNNGFTIVSINSQNISWIETWIIRAYKDIFSASSWREWVKCSLGCGFKATFEEAPKICPICPWDIEDFYSDEEVSASIRSVLDKSYYQFLILLSWKKVAGFSWWWSDPLDTINQEKLWLTEWIQLPKLIQSLENLDIPLNNPLYYLAEVGIVREFQWKKLGKSLVAQGNILLQEVKKNINSTILRTSRNSPMYNIQKSLGAQEVFSYEDSDERVLFARNNS